ncbi:MAG: serine/threonine-protein kinase, partial [Gammaproteobacteria bacterium]|nr:serine/threonine-protein kinase [Gammaproteobacteria bacterium]
MAELKKLLSALIQGTGSFEQVNAAVQQFLARSPDKAPLVAKLLRAARDAGLPHPMYVSLSGNVTTRIAMGRDPDATVLALDDGGVNPDRPAPAPPEPMPPSNPPAQAPAGDATRFDGAKDRTETTADPAASWEQKTELLKPNGEDNEATQMEAGLDDNPTRINPNIDPSEGAAGGGADAFHSDATEINPEAEGDTTSGGADATDKTIALDGEVDFDIFSDEALASAEETEDPDTGANWPTIRDPNHPGISRAFREGDHLRDRFQLLSKLGEGGMGAVWKGKDMLKEEARDRNPFVAIKLLQGDFKEHPEAFIALQRETAKQQRLAHPNIATVYDFDRDDSSNTVFMTMEVLEGQPLDSFIRRLPAGGLSVEQAMPLIEQLCNGLAYAHSHALVHADLKPGNCFYTKDGTIKLLDFGIARASKTKADAEGETTLFDPGELGALTPTYATLEMFEGADPDPRDDIYALAIMTYQLLTGKHPYGKKSAPKAKELELKPEPIAKLNKRQNKALMRGLAFEREDRTATVEEFYESIRPKKSRAPMFAAAGVAALLIVAIGIYGPARDFVDKYRRDQIISIMEKPGLANLRQGLNEANALGDPEQINLILNDPRTKSALVAYVADGKENKVNELLALIAPYDPNWQRDVKEDEQVKSAIMNVFNEKIHQAFNVNQDRYDYATASALIGELDRLYPDSAKVLQRKTQLNQERANKLAELSEDYTRYLEEGRLLPEQDVRDIGDVIEVVRQIDPDNALLRDDRLRFRYGELAETAIDEKAYGRADALLRASLSYAPGDAKLTDLRFRVQAELQRIANERRVAEIEQRVGPKVASLNALPDFLEIRDDLIALRDLSPESALLAEI